MEKCTTPQVQALAEAIIPADFKKLQHHAVMLFYMSSELGLEHHDPLYGKTGWVCTRVIKTPSYQKALDLYSNIACPASQLVSSDTKEGLDKEIDQMKANFQDEKWLEENIDPYI